MESLNAKKAFLRKNIFKENLHVQVQRANHKLVPIRKSILEWIEYFCALNKTATKTHPGPKLICVDNGFQKVKNNPT